MKPTLTKAKRPTVQSLVNQLEHAVRNLEASKLSEIMDANRATSNVEQQLERAKQNLKDVNEEFYKLKDEAKGCQNQLESTRELLKGARQQFQLLFGIFLASLAFNIIQALS